MFEPLTIALIDAAIGAGRIILDIYGGDFAVETKKDASPVTAADEAAESHILACLKEAAPEIPVIAEEEVAAGRVPGLEHRFILVDPLDGTKEFISRNGEFTVNIALIEGGRPIAGVVLAPVTGVIYVGEVGKGAWSGKVNGSGEIDWQPARVRNPAPAALTVVASRSHLTDDTKAFIERFDVGEMVSTGSSLKFCRLAVGDADLYPRLGRTMEWDTAAGDAVLRAAGGEVLTMDGQPLAYGKRDQADDSDFANPWFVACGAVNPFTASA